MGSTRSRRAFLRAAVAAGAAIGSGCATPPVSSARAPRRGIAEPSTSRATTNISVPKRPRDVGPTQEIVAPAAPTDDVVVETAGPLPARPPLDPNVPLRCAIVGVGGQGSALLQALLERNDVVVAAVADAYDVWRDRALTWCNREGGAAGYVTYQDMLETEDLHAVFIAAPDHIHADAARAVLEAGVDLYVEPPLALGWGDAAELASAARQRGAVVQMGFARRSTALADYARTVMLAGEIGDLVAVNVERQYKAAALAELGTPREASKSNVHWSVFLGDTDAVPFDLTRYFQWARFREYSNANMGALLAPSLDLCHYITGAGMPERVVASGGSYLYDDGRTCPDTFSMIASYPEAFHVTFTCTPVRDGESVRERYVGSSGSIEIDDLLTMRIYREGACEAWTGDAAPGGAHLDDFLRCVRSRQQPIAPVDSGLLDAAVSAMAMHAIESGRAYMWDAAQHLAAPVQG